MSFEKIKNPIVKTISYPQAFDGIPQVTNINYDLWTLRITLIFNDIENPLYVTFKNICGFRVLDEGDLLEFWNSKIIKAGWLWRVEQGGWFDLESLYEGIITSTITENLIASNITKRYREYLILGADDCVSILSDEKPIFVTT